VRSDAEKVARGGAMVLFFFDTWAMAAIGGTAAALICVLLGTWWFLGMEDPKQEDLLKKVKKVVEEAKLAEVAEAGAFPDSTRVVLAGLTRPGLNGKAGRVVGFDPKTERYLVELAGRASWSKKTTIKVRPKNMQRRDAKEECAICLSEAVEPVKLPCGHIFCGACISRMRSQALQDPATADACPLCRAACGDDAQKAFLQAALELIRAEQKNGAPRHDPAAASSWHEHERGAAHALPSSAIQALEKALEKDPEHVRREIMV